VGNGGTVIMPLQNKKTMESIEEEDETQVNAITTMNVPTIVDRSPRTNTNMSIHHMQGPYADSFYNQSPMKMMGNPETK
jgi:hypothetical protein